MSRSYSTPESGLTRRAISAGFAFAVMTGIERGLLFVRALVLARLLEPKEFGLMGMAFIAINAAEVLSQTGFGRAIIQRRDDPTPFMDTVWVVSAVRGLFLAIVVFVTAPLFADFFRTSELLPVLRAISLALVLRGFVSPAWILLERQLRLKRFALPATIGAGVDLIVTCTLAVQLRSVWAMVFGFLSGTAVIVGMSYVVGPYRPRLRFSLARARELHVFGKHIFRTEVTVVAYEQADRLAVGRIGDVVSLGFYSFAQRMATLPITMFSMVVLRVVFPSFAHIQASPDRVRDAFVRLMRLTAATAFPVAFGLYATAPEVVSFVFGKRWIPMTGAFRILCFLGATIALEKCCTAVTGGIGRPQLAARASLLRLILMSVAIVPATWLYGIEGAAIATTSSAIAGFVYLLRCISKAIGIKSRGYLVVFGIPAAACAAMLVTLDTVRILWTGSIPPAAAVALLVGAGAISYTLVAATIDRLTGSALSTTLIRVIRSR